MSTTSISSLRKDCEQAGVTLPIASSLEPLFQILPLGSVTVSNRMAVQPMEGADGMADGSPDELTLRRYLRFAAGGAGLIWAEAIAVTEAGRGNDRHLWLHEGNVDAFRSMIDDMRQTARRTHGQDIVIIAQLTHAGRYSKPWGSPLPLIAGNIPHYEGNNPLPADRIVTDDELRRLEDDFGRTAALAEKAGFDGVDIKACHRYLTGELLAAFTRPGPYGGDYEGRTAFLRHCVESARAACPADYIVTSRLNIYDGVPNPYGWGQDRDDYLQTDFTEPLRLIGEFHEGGMGLINITMGNPYVNPHVNRPYRRGGYKPPEQPLKGVERILNGAGVVQRAFPDLAVLSSGISYLGEASDVVAAGMVEQAMAKLVGFGRMAFACPDFAAEILSGRGITKNKACLACTKCTELMRARTTTGCPVRDREVYLPLYREHCMNGG